MVFGENISFEIGGLELFYEGGGEVVGFIVLVHQHLTAYILQKVFHGDKLFPERCGGFLAVCLVGVRAELGTPKSVPRHIKGDCHIVWLDFLVKGDQGSKHREKGIGVLALGGAQDFGVVFFFLLIGLGKEHRLGEIPIVGGAEHRRAVDYQKFFHERYHTFL